MRRIVGLLVLAGCTHASVSPAPARAPLVVVPPLVVEAAPPHASACELGEPTSIDDGQGVVDQWGAMVLENVRILADDARTVVTWTRRLEPKTGDSYREPHAAVRSDSATFAQVFMPVHSTACSTYGSVAPNTRELPFVFWGVLNMNAFEQFSELPEASADKTTLQITYTTPVRSVTTPKQSVDVFVASHDVALATVTDMSCDMGCTCPDSWKDALWLRSLDRSRPFATRVAAGKIDAPAFVLTDKGGIAAWRKNEELFLVRVNADGAPIGDAWSFANGDVGAPAVAMSGEDALVVWASRPDKTSPYALQWMKVGGAVQSIPTAGSAFAPAIIADEHDVVLAWMEGDGGRVGQIHAVRAPVGGPIDGHVAALSGDEPNARDPELSGSVDRPVVVWSTFTKEKAAGILRVGELSCAAGTKDR